jgi:hypothetical protein
MNKDQCFDKWELAKLNINRTVIHSAVFCCLSVRKFECMYSSINIVKVNRLKSHLSHYCSLIGTSFLVFYIVIEREALFFF